MTDITELKSDVPFGAVDLDEFETGGPAVPSMEAEPDGVLP